MSEKYHEDSKNSIKFWICKKVDERDEVKVKDHDYVTGKYKECAHQI